MGFNQKTSIDSINRLGRTRNLLKRERIAIENGGSGNTLFGEIASFLLERNSGGGLLTIVGHPSAGKTTEFNRLAKELSSKNKLDSYLPIYSELQNSEQVEISGDASFIWQGIVSGSIDFEIHGHKAAESLEEFCDFARSEGLTPLLMIDTLDILMLQEVSDKKLNVAKLWSSFLKSVTDNDAIIVWTCRPFEWNKFKQELGELEISEVALPVLEESQLEPFLSIKDLGLELPKTEFDLDNYWQDWSKKFQSHMPIFADRWQTYTNTKRKLDSDLFKVFAENFVKYTTNEIGKEVHWLSYAQEHLPSEDLYTWLWNQIDNRLEFAYGIGNVKCHNFRDILEETAKNTALNKNKNSSRVRISYQNLIDNLSISQELTKLDIHDLFSVCESRGLLSRSGPWVDFSHQLLFEEALISNANKSELEKLKKFPSILLRELASPEKFLEVAEDYQDEVLSAIGHWNGHRLSYHPLCLARYPNLPGHWKDWIEFAKNNLNHLIAPDVEFDEESEKRVILESYYHKTNGDAALLVNGAPGTGKTHICLYFLADKLRDYKKSKEKRIWRYYTLNENLSQHFGKLAKRYVEKEDSTLWGLSNVDGSSNPIKRLLKDILGKIVNLEKKIYPSSIQHQSQKDRIDWQQMVKNWEGKDGKRSKREYGSGLLDFSIFKVLLKKYYETPAVKHQGIKNPPLAEAWHQYNTVIHDPVSGNRVDKESLQNEVDKELINFHEAISNHWWTYSFASFKARVTIDQLGARERKAFEHDLLMVDEIQDIMPPVLALLLDLMTKDYPKHSILIAGDKLQTVNRSGFVWSKFTEDTKRALSFYSHYNSSERLSKFGASYTNGLQTNKFTLKFVWRNGTRLVEFNNQMRKNFGSSFGIAQKYNELFNYEDENLEITKQAEEKDKDSLITVIECNSANNLESIMNNLKEVSKSNLLPADLRVAVMSPFEIEDSWSKEIGFHVYDTDMVKGLEFDSVVVLMPYLIPDDEARSYLPKLKEPNPEKVQTQIQKWATSWKADKKDEISYNKFEKFNDLYCNMFTRMNVLFSRPEKRILIINPLEFNKGVQYLPGSKENQKMISLGSPPIPLSGQIKYERRGKKRSPDKMSEIILEALKCEKSSSSGERDFEDSLQFTISQAILNDNGTQTDNERKAWDQLWGITKDNPNLPLSAIAYAGGIEFTGNPDILRLLRSDIIKDNDFTLHPGSIRDEENQFVCALRECKFNEESVMQITPDNLYFIYSNLSDFVQKVMNLTHKDELENLHRFMMKRIFGINIDDIKDYKFDKFVNDEIKIKSFNLQNISKGIGDNEEDPYYEIEPNSENLRDKIVYHLASRLSSLRILNQAAISEDGWAKKQRDFSIWNPLVKHVNDGTFDTNFVSNPENKNLLNWMKTVLSNKSEMIRAGQGMYTGEKGKTKLEARKKYPLKFKTTPHQWRKWFTERGPDGDDDYRKDEYFAWLVHQNVLPKLSGVRASYNQRDVFYLSIYDHLNLDYDASGLQLFHEILEAEFTKGVSSGNAYDSVISKIKNLNLNSISKGYETLQDNFAVLESTWFSREANLSTHKFDQRRGGSVIGALLHLHCLDTKDMSKYWEWGGIMKSFARYLDNYFDKSKQPIHNLKDYWLKFNLQDDGFRYLFSANLDQFNKQNDKSNTSLVANFSGEGDARFTTKGNFSRMLSRLLMMDFIALSDKTWNGKLAINGELKGVGIKFGNSMQSDRLRNLILDCCNDQLDNTGNQFFNTYIEDLDKFLNRKSLEQSARKRKISITDLKRFSPEYFFNDEIHQAWEWLLFMLEERTDVSKQFDNLLSSKLRLRGLKDKRYGLHRLLRTNYSKSELNRIKGHLGKIYIDVQYILSKPAGKLTNKDKRTVARLIWDWTKLEPKSKSRQERKQQRFAKIHRKIYTSASLLENKNHINYVDWEIIFNLWRCQNLDHQVELTNTPNGENPFQHAIELIMDSMFNGLINIFEDAEGYESVKFNLQDLLDASNSNYAGEINTLIGAILSADNYFKELLTVTKGTKLTEEQMLKDLSIRESFSQFRNTPFSELNSSKKYRINLAEGFVNYLINHFIERYDEYFEIEFKSTNLLGKKGLTSAHLSIYEGKLKS